MIQNAKPIVNSLKFIFIDPNRNFSTVDFKLFSIFFL